MQKARVRAGATSSVRAQLAEIGARPRKSLGQHFLHDASVADRIVALVRPGPGETVIEIGPGLGILSDRLVQSCERLVLIELDGDLAARAVERFAAALHVRVVHADALHVDWNALLPTRGLVVGNLPYNVGTAILQRLLERRERVRRIVAMVQKEVAERLVAQAGDSAYGALSVLTQFDCRPSLIFTVAPGAFSPRPKVHSAVVTLDTHAVPPVQVGNEARFRRLVRMVFQHRRKQLANALRGVIGEPREVLQRIAIDPMRRPETLTLAEFARLESESGDA
jgi:16S rRNA (adenine1518-N6/adenine1519-N6)-dimethyltransferase